MKKIAPSLTNLLRKFAGLVLIFGGFIVLPGYAGNLAGPEFKTWQEEVKLNDGRIVVVTQKRRCQEAYTGGNHAACIEREAWLTVKLSEISEQEIVWHENLKPRVLNLFKGNLYIVGWPATGYEFGFYGNPQPPYIGFVFEKDNWKRIPLQEIPEAIYDTNLVIDGSLVKTNFLTLLEKNSSELNGDFAYPKRVKRIDPSYKSNFH